MRTRAATTALKDKNVSPGEGLTFDHIIAIVDQISQLAEGPASSPSPTIVEASQVATGQDQILNNGIQVSKPAARRTVAKKATVSVAQNVSSEDIEIAGSSSSQSEAIILSTSKNKLGLGLEENHDQHQLKEPSKIQVS